MKEHASMNRIYRIVWSQLLGTMVVVSETTKGRGKARGSRALVASALSLLSGLFIIPHAQAGPTGGQVSAGAGTIVQTGNSSTINQSSQHLAINWQGFSVGAHESVRFNQPNASSVALNRVVGQDPSNILGSLSANGQVFVVNPNGVLFGAGAQVNVGALVATTMHLSDADLLAGNYRFAGVSGASGSVVNQGSLSAANGGYIALLAPEVRNEGLISATQGTALLGAADRVTLRLGNGSLLGYTIDQGALNALVANKQAIRADGGQVILSATAANAVGSAVVNNTGVVEAKGISTRGGVIRLEADLISQTGTLDASASSGHNGGRIELQARAILDAGTAKANGQNGGNITYTARQAIVQTASAQVQANGAGQGGTVHLDGGNSFFSSGSLQATGAQGGTIDALGQRVVLAAAKLDASGAQQGGLVRVGGDFHGNNAQIANAQTTFINGASTIKADGGRGQVVIWSDKKTDYYGSISAQQAGTIEVSSKGTLTYAGQAHAGTGGTLLLDPANIIIDDSLGPAAFSLIDPNPVSGNAFGQTVTQLSGPANGNVVVSVSSDNLGGSNAGAVYVFNTTTGALVSTLVGSHANDAVGNVATNVVGNNGVVALSNGNFLVVNSRWNSNAGAVTWGSGTLGVSGVVSSTNSLVGNTNDQVGTGGVTLLSNGNYVVASPNWTYTDSTPATFASAGAATWGSGTVGVNGLVSSANSLVGSHANDQVGRVVTALSNGNYVVSTRFWNSDTGAVRWSNGGSGSRGIVDGTNSLVGTNANDRVGSGGVLDLGNGSYVVTSSSWGGGKGAVTWGDATGATIGEVSSSNSLVGSTAGDAVGNGGITLLSNQNYVIRSTSWSSSKGAVTWGNGSSGTAGALTTSNSLLGVLNSDNVGNGGVVAVGNGNYVVISHRWGSNKGAVTWMDGSQAPVSAIPAIDASNSLVGTLTTDRVGLTGVTVLTNGNYVVRSANWNSSRGAVTWGSGATGARGVVGAGNSLVGTTANDGVGATGVVALGNGNYVVRSNNWRGSSPLTSLGAVTWGDGIGGTTVGAVDATNSLVGSVANDRVGSGGVTVLSNNNYVVTSNNWNSSRGAVTWGNGLAGTSGAVDATNSLVGSSSGDTVGSSGVLALTNGNYVVRSAAWNANRGAITWGNGSTSGTRTAGSISSANSLVGTTAGDLVGSNFGIALSNGNYVVGSTSWGGSKGAVSWGNGLGGTVGDVSASNSLVGTAAGDSLGATNNTFALADGNYVVTSPSWSANKGAVTWGSGANGVSGEVTQTNSLLGANAGELLGNGGVKSLDQGNYLVSSPSAAGTDRALMVGVPGNIYFATGHAAGSTMGFNPSRLTATLASGTDVTMQASNDITVNAAINVTGSAGGRLTLQAGRHINLNSVITTANGNFSATAGDPGAIAADRLAGTPTITLGSGARINAGTGTVTLAAVGGNFVNNSGSSTPITAARTLIYSTDPAANTKGGMVLANKHYNQAFVGVGMPPSYAGSGDWFFYTIAPVISVTPGTKYGLVYGTNPGAFTANYSGFIDGDTSSTAGISGTANFTIGGAKSTSNNYIAGAHEVTYDSGLLSSLGYTFADNAASVNEYTVTRLALTGTIGTGSSVYGSALAAGSASFTNALTGDQLGTASVGIATTGRTSNAGHLTARTHTGIQSVTALSGADADNYTFATVRGDYTVSRLALNGSISTGSSVYGSALAAGSASFTNALTGDQLGTASVNVDTTGRTSNAGHLTARTHTGIQSVTALSGADADNYSLAGVTGDYTVGRLALTGTIGTGSSVYGGALVPGVVALRNVQAGDNVIADRVAVDANALRNASGQPVAGTYRGVQSLAALSGSDADNYTFSGIRGDYVVQPAQISTFAEPPRTFSVTEYPSQDIPLMMDSSDAMAKVPFGMEADNRNLRDRESQAQVIRYGLFSSMPTVGNAFIGTRNGGLRLPVGFVDASPVR